MATAWRKVKSEKNIKFTIEDLLKVQYGKSDYAKYDNSVCQWNQFLKDFCADENSRNYSNKLKVASILWKEVRNSEKEKIYSKNLLTEYAYKLEEYRKQIGTYLLVNNSIITKIETVNLILSYYFCSNQKNRKNKKKKKHVDYNAT